MKKTYTAVLYLITDALFAVLSLYFALQLRFDFSIPEEATAGILTLYPVIIGAVLIFSYVLGCYGGIVQYTGFPELIRQMVAVLITCAVVYFIKIFYSIRIPDSVIIIMGGYLFMSTGGSRVVPRIIPRFQIFLHKRAHQTKRVLIVGAGACGAMIIKRLQDDSKSALSPVACVDDDPAKRDLRICGLRVLGSTDEIGKIVQKCGAEQILIAIPSADTKTIRKIYEKCIPTGLPVKLFQKEIDAEMYIKGVRSALKEVIPEDLLCRDSVEADSNIARAYIAGKTVLVTGGAGSIGSELCRQTLKNGSKKLIIFDLHENGLFELDEELKETYPADSYELVLGSIRDKTRLNSVFAQYKPQLVFHAAANKHVPLSEFNPFEAVKNNIFGTKNVIDACRKFGTAKFILISTDKAVNPTNIMGASKRIAEMVVQTENCPETVMAAVRFGNVLGSNGSVIPTFKKQIASGGPVTVTHPDMKRFFMTIPEAVSLVQAAAALAGGGETFVLNMGEPVKILDMAEDLIRLSGLEPGRDIAIKFTGLRAGEKLFEELSLDSESVNTTSHSKIFVMRSPMIDQIKLRRDLLAITACAEEEKELEKIRSLIFSAIREDPVWNEVQRFSVN